jgi:tRNA-(ms[2]io[6]A)-hydroxylase
MLCLTVQSDAEWATAAVAQLGRVLVDHAHCERKAASNAYSLIERFPASPTVRQALLGIATEETDHFRRVLRLLEERGLAFGAPSVDAYAADLRRASRNLPPFGSPLVDRLLVGALIEARSCERFKLLIQALDGAPRADRDRLQDFYRELLASEAGHYRTFVDLALEAAAPIHDEVEVMARLGALARLEEEIVRGLAASRARATVHG